MLFARNVSAEAGAGNSQWHRCTARVAPAAVRKEDFVQMAVITFTTEPVEDPTSATPTHYQQVATDLIAALDAFVSIIPKIDEAEDSDAKQVRKNLNVPDAFCYAVISAAEQVPELEAREYTEADRNRLQYLEAFRPVYAKLVAVADTLRHGLRANQSIVGGHALEIYRVATARVKSALNPALRAFHATMKAALAKKVPTKAEREAAAKKKFDDAVEQEVQVRLAKLAAEPQQKEVIAA